MPPHQLARSRPFVCNWHTGCQERFTSKRQLFHHLENAHGMPPAAGYRAGGVRARSRRRDDRWQFDDFGNPVIQKVFSATPSINRSISKSTRVRSLGSPYGPMAGYWADNYIHRVDEHGRSHWEPRAICSDPPQPPMPPSSPGRPAAPPTSSDARPPQNLARPSTATSNDHMWGAPVGRARQMQAACHALQL